MALVQAMNGTKLLVQIGDGGSPETFAADCLINAERGIQFASDTNRQIIPDCDTPDAPAWSTLTKDGLNATVTGGGMLHTTSVPVWDAWFNSDDAKNTRVLVDVPGASGGGYWAGAFKLTGWEITGNRNEKATVSVTLESDGVVAWTDAA